MPLDPRSGDPTGPDQDPVVIACDQREGWAQFVDRHGQVGIHEEDESPPCVKDSARDRCALAKIAAVPDEADARRGCSKIRDDRRRLVSRSIIDHDHFRGKRARAQVLAHDPERRLDGTCLVVGRDHYRQLDRSRCASVCHLIWVGNIASLHMASAGRAATSVPHTVSDELFQFEDPLSEHGAVHPPTVRPEFTEFRWAHHDSHLAVRIAFKDILGARRVRRTAHDDQRAGTDSGCPPRQRTAPHRMSTSPTF